MKRANYSSQRVSFLENAPAAQFCAETTFADGKTGYLPALGELTHICAYKTDVDACLTACGGKTLPSGSKYMFSSTQAFTNTIWCLNCINYGPARLAKNNAYDKYTRVVSAF